MNEPWDWDDLRMFLSVARAGGLAKAVTGSGASAPTLGRRMTGLERAMGIALFTRRRDGYVLTESGKHLLGLAETIEHGALAVDRWRAAAGSQTAITIAAGSWTSAFLARHVHDLTGGDEGLAIKIVSGGASADLLRREANLGLRNDRPKTPGLAGRRLVRVAFSVYGETGFVARMPEALGEARFEACPWIVFAPGGPKTPSAAWLDRHLRRDALLVCTTAQAVLAAASAGAGLCVLPCFVGDREPGLSRASGLVRELEHDQWLVSHDDDRHSKAIRLVSDRLAKLVRSHEALFSGEHAA